jgi:hypothetical protein
MKVNLPEVRVQVGLPRVLFNIFNFRHDSL